MRRFFIEGSQKIAIGVVLLLVLPLEGSAQYFGPWNRVVHYETQVTQIEWRESNEEQRSDPAEARDPAELRRHPHYRQVFRECRQQNRATRGRKPPKNCEEFALQSTEFLLYWNEMPLTAFCTYWSDGYTEHDAYRREREARNCVDRRLENECSGSELVRLRDRLEHHNRTMIYDIGDRAETPTPSTTYYVQFECE